MAEVLAGVVKARLNVIVSGGTGSGKTTMLNALSGFIPEDERIITIEDSAELQLQQPHVVRLETRPANIEGKGEIKQRELVRNSLRMRPERIVVGEVRGEEAFDMLQAMNTGHDGSLTTVHANSSRDALARLENMVAMAGLDLPARAIRTQIASAVNVMLAIVPSRRRATQAHQRAGNQWHGRRRHHHERDLHFRAPGIDENGRVIGRFRATGIIPNFREHLQKRGIHIGTESFDPNREEEWGEL